MEYSGSNYHEEEPTWAKQEELESSFGSQHPSKLDECPGWDRPWNWAGLIEKTVIDGNLGLDRIGVLSETRVGFDAEKRGGTKVEYDIQIHISGDEDMVEINIRQGPHGDFLCYGGCDPKVIPGMVEGAVKEFIHELKTGEHP